MYTHLVKGAAENTPLARLMLTEFPDEQPTDHTNYFEIQDT